MQTFSTWNVDTSQILTRTELARVLATAGDVGGAAHPPRPAAPLLDGVRRTRLGSAAVAHHSPRAAHVHLARPGRRADTGRGPGGRGARQLTDDERVPARGGGR